MQLNCAPDLWAQDRRGDPELCQPVEGDPVRGDAPLADRHHRRRLGAEG